MSTSDDEYITTEDVVNYLQEQNPELLEDEMEELYRRIHYHYQNHLKNPDDCPEEVECDLEMAKYYLTQSWIVDDSIDKVI